MARRPLQIGVELALMALFVPPMAAQAMTLAGSTAEGPAQITVIQQMTDEVAPYGEVPRWHYVAPAKPKKKQTR